MIDQIYRLETFEDMTFHFWKSYQCGKSNRAASILENFCRRDPMECLKIFCKKNSKKLKGFYTLYYLNIDETRGPSGEKL